MRTRRLLSLIGLFGPFACEPSSKPDPEPAETGTPGGAETGPPGGEDTHDGEIPEDSGPIESVGGSEVEEDTDDLLLTPDEVALFDDTVLHEVALTLGDEATAALRADPYSWVEGDLSLDGEALSSVGVRLRGKIGSFREIDGKPKFKIDFNRYVEGQEHLGLEGVSLNNEVVDCGYIKEITGYAIYHALGLPAPRTAFATVTVDGEPYGLYLLVEHIDDRFLKQRYEAPDGNLYDGKYLYYGGYDYDLVDFTGRLQDNFTLEEGVDVGRSDIYAITEAVRDDSSAFSARMDPLVDLDQLHRVWIAEQWIGHLDGYTLNRNNYRVYVNPYDGRAEIIPWDLDYAFINASDWGFNWRSPSGALIRGCYSDDACQDAHRAAVAEALEAVDTDALLARIDAWVALIEDAALADPKRECPTRSVDDYQVGVRTWIEEGESELERFWAD